MKDYMVRATAANAQIRAFACTTRETVETARAAHNTSPVVTAALGRLLSAGVMMGSMLKGDDELITLQIKGDGPIGGLTVTADRNGHVKGYANVPDVILPANAQGKLDVGGAVGAGVLSVIRDMGLKDPYVGQTDLQIVDQFLVADAETDTHSRHSSGLGKRLNNQQIFVFFK
jgi:molecular chaperone Hsp33